MTIIAIHQPEYLPWLGFFKKMMNSKLFILLDDVQFEKKSWQSRNRIRTVNGTTFLSVPVHAHLDSKINEIKIDSSKNWADKHRKSILYNYTKTPYFVQPTCTRRTIDSNLFWHTNVRYTYAILRKIHNKIFRIL